MGKRSDFRRVERDYYPTPHKAVLPLREHLSGFFQYVEPCAGNGALISHIQDVFPQSECLCALDVEPQSNISSVEIKKGDSLNTEFPDVHYIITNPPWDRKILHKMIDKFRQKASTWLLFDASWAHTKQSIPYQKFCSCIVSVGRVKWIENSKMTGKDDCAWYKFEANPVDFTKFYGPKS